MNIRKINLNLLKALDAVLTERHITRAAAKIFITQPAMSNALNQLRQLFDDKLLVTGKNGMIPTPKALELGPLVKNILKEIETIFSLEEEINPSTLSCTFKIGASDYGELVVLPKLVQTFSKIAPNISIEVIHLNEITSAELFETGEIDMAIGLLSKPIPSLQSTLLFIENAICVGRQNHPLMKKPFTLQKYLTAKHLAIGFQSDKKTTLTDLALKRNKKNRNIAVTVPHMLPALHYVATSDLIATVPKRLGIIYQKLLKLTLLPPPFPIQETHIMLVWHARNEKDPKLKWLRERIENEWLE